MPFKIKPPAMAVRLRDEPRDEAPNALGLIQIGDVVEKVADATQAGWWRVRVVTQGATPREGFVRADNLVEAEAEPIPVEIDKKAFFTQLGFAARTFGANREYLYAVAFFESGGVKNVKSKSSEAFGPFQFMPETWKDLVGKFGNQDGVTEADIVVPSKQVLFAARYANASQQALTEKLKHVPTAVELYLAHLLGNAGASAALSPPTSRPIDAGLRENFSASFVDSVLVANRNLLTDGDRVRTTDEVLDQIAGHLDKGLEEAAALAKELGPPITQTPNDQGEPPWLAVALAELAKNVIEDKAGSNPVIEDYLRATTYSGAISDDVAWCAAFVTWCMSNSTNDIVVAKNKKSAWVPDWLNWGYDVGRPIRGAVAIVSPLRDGAAGHIGIVTGETDKNIVLLGGNQRNKQGQESVCETQFSKLAAVSYRWLDWK